ncbi:MAG: hypothetical protein R3D02_07425 [Hyphomicrobiales bacterium]
MAEPLRAPTAAIDLLDFSGEALYFDEPNLPVVAELIATAQAAPAPALARARLEEALRLAPDDLTVIVALYRFFYFQHDFAAALPVAALAMNAAGRRLNIPGDWRALKPADIERSGRASMAMTRFYLWALKGEAYLLMRLGRFEDAVAPLEKLVELDAADRLGGSGLLDLARKTVSDLSETGSIL